MVLSVLNHTDGYPVTWVAKVGQMGESSMSFQELLAEKKKEARRKQEGSEQSHVTIKQENETHNVRT